MEQIFQPYVQAGFAGLSFLLVGVIVWLVRQVLGVLRETHSVIERNTAALDRLHVAISANQHELERLQRLLYARPCLADAKDA